jgi:hypothetical protein
MTCYGELTQQMTDDGSQKWDSRGQPEGGLASLIRAGTCHRFTVETPDGPPDNPYLVSAQFTDDPGLRWQLDHLMHLVKLPRSHVALPSRPFHWKRGSPRALRAWPLAWPCRQACWAQHHVFKGAAVLIGF